MPPSVVKPTVFVGSSKEAINIAYAVQAELELNNTVEVIVWSQGIFQLSSNTLDDLIRTLDTTDFGVFVFSPDDILEIRNHQSLAVRDNVIFELGLFIGRLGKERSFFLIPRNQSELHLPTDLLGITAAIYDANRLARNSRAAVGSACFQIRSKLEQFGISKRSSNNELVTDIAHATQATVEIPQKDMQQYAELARTAHSLGITGISCNWKDISEFRGTLGTDLRNRISEVKDATWYIITMNPGGFQNWIGDIRKAVEDRGVDVKWAYFGRESLEKDDACKLLRVQLVEWLSRNPDNALNCF